MSRNFDYPHPNQGWAAKQMLAQVQQDAAALDAAIRNDDRIPAWTIEKLATGTDRIGAAARYLLYKARHAPTYAGHYGGYNDETMGERVRRMAPSLLIFGLFVYGLHTAAGGWSPPSPVRKRRAR
jgi:hypothetical protein